MRYVNSDRSRYFALVSYGTESQILDVLEQHSQSIRSYCYIIHDRDEAVNHIHIALRLFSANKVPSIVKWFSLLVDDDGKKINTFAEIVFDRCSFRSYLVHVNSDGTPIDGKSVYDVSEIRGNPNDVLIKDDESSNVCSEILQDMLNGVDYLTLVQQYGGEFVHNVRNYTYIYSEYVTALNKVKDDLYIKEVDER